MYYIECLDSIKSSGPVSLLVITTQTETLWLFLHMNKEAKALNC